MIYIPILILIALVVGIVWSTISMVNQAKRDWATLEYLKEKANKLTGDKKELEEFHAELREKGSKIYNRYITTKLMEIDGYVRGMYKQHIKK